MTNERVKSVSMNDIHSTRKPVSDRPLMPDGYGVPDNNESLLPWSYIEEHMQKARNYWISTANREGKPAATPVWGAWIDGKLYFDGSPETRRGRNITENPKVVVHLESGDSVVILEGEAVILSGAPERSLAARLSEAYTAKYKESGYSPGPESWDGGGLFIFTPEKAMGWTKFPEDLTRWKL
jgi:nitroimidazol reductase NimA-like FMN-containing flavoprotein (pyridoxamine 5'-phosphate oxidase superfamily)